MAKQRRGPSWADERYIDLANERDLSPELHSAFLSLSTVLLAAEGQQPIQLGREIVGRLAQSRKVLFQRRPVLSESDSLALVEALTASAKAYLHALQAFFVLTDLGHVPVPPREDEGAPSEAPSPL